MTSGTLTFSRFIVGDIFCCVEDVEEIEDLTVFGVLAVCEELGVFFDGVITFSFGFSVSSIQVNNVCASTELKTRLVTLAYYFCVSESFVAETNLHASWYVMFFSYFIFCISFVVLKK